MFSGPLPHLGVPPKLCPYTAPSVPSLSTCPFWLPCVHQQERPWMWLLQPAVLTEPDLLLLRLVSMFSPTCGWQIISNGEPKLKSVGKFWIRDLLWVLLFSTVVSTLSDHWRRITCWPCASDAWLGTKSQLLVELDDPTLHPRKCLRVQE